MLTDRVASSIRLPSPSPSSQVPPQVVVGGKLPVLGFCFDLTGTTLSGNTDNLIISFLWPDFIDLPKT